MEAGVIDVARWGASDYRLTCYRYGEQELPPEIAGLGKSGWRKIRDHYNGGKVERRTWQIVLSEKNANDIIRGQERMASKAKRLKTVLRPYQKEPPVDVEVVAYETYQLELFWPQESIPEIDGLDKSNWHRPSHSGKTWVAEINEEQADRILQSKKPSE
jgi:hypothetical protein